MTKAEDDDRAIDWAPRKIRALEGQVERMSENFTVRLDKLEDTLAALTSPETKDRWSEVVAQFDHMRGDSPELERWPMKEFNPPAEEYSAPIGRSQPTSEDMARQGGIFAVGDPARGVVPGAGRAATAGRSEEGQYQRAWYFGHAAAVDEIESRVVAALDRIDLQGRHRDEILNAVRPESTPNRGEVPSEGRIPEQKYITVSKAEKRVRAYAEEQNWSAHSIDTLIKVMKGENSGSE